MSPAPRKATRFNDANRKLFSKPGFNLLAKPYHIFEVTRNCELGVFSDHNAGKVGDVSP